MENLRPRHRALWTRADYCDEAGAFKPHIVAKDGLTVKRITRSFTKLIGNITQIENDQRVLHLLNFFESDNEFPSFPRSDH